jgi:hypothetical protein
MKGLRARVWIAAPPKPVEGRASLDALSLAMTIEIRPSEGGTGL